MSRQGPFSKDNATSNENVKRVERTSGAQFVALLLVNSVFRSARAVVMVDTLYLLNLANIRDLWKKSNTPRWIETYKKDISKCITNASKIPRSVQNFPRTMIS